MVIKIIPDSINAANLLSFSGEWNLIFDGEAVVSNEMSSLATFQKQNYITIKNN